MSQNKKQVIRSLTLKVLNNDYVSALKLYADHHQQEVEYIFENIPSPREAPLFKVKCVFQQFITTSTGCGKKIPKQQCARDMLSLIERIFVVNSTQDGEVEKQVHYLTPKVLNNDYVSALKLLADQYQQEVEYVFESVPSPGEAPLFESKCIFRQLVTTSVGCGKKIPKQQCAKDMLGLIEKTFVADLTRDGDVENNPGPVNWTDGVRKLALRNATKSCMRITGDFSNFDAFPNVRHLKVALRNRIIALENARQRQHEKNKTLVRKLRQIRKEQRFQFQMEREDLVKLIKSPSVQRAAAYAATNFVLPGAGTAAATVVEGAKVLDATNKVRDAAESLADTCMTQIPELIATHTNLADIAASTLSNINSLTSRLQQENGLLATINKFVKNVTTQVSALGMIITLILCFAAMAWDWKIGCAVIMLALIYFNWPKAVTDKIRQLLGVAGWKFEMNGSEHIPLIGQICFTLLAFFGVSQIPTDKFYDNLLKRLDIVPKAFTGLSKIWDQAGKMFELVSDEFKVYFLGVKREDLMQEKGIVDEVDKWVTRV